MEYTLHHQGLFGESYLEPHPKQTEFFQLDDIVQVKPKYQNEKMYSFHNIGYLNLKYKVVHVWEPTEDDKKWKVNILSVEKVITIMENPFRTEFEHYPSYDFVDVGWLEKIKA